MNLLLAPPSADLKLLQRVAAVLRQLAPVSDEAMGELLALMQPRVFDTGACLLEGGQPARWCFFVARGLVREYYLGTGGEEHTRAFITEGLFTGSLSDLLSGRPAVTWIQALEPTETLAFSYAAYDALCARHGDLNHLARRFAETLYQRKARREHELLAWSAAERYAQWCALHPALDARISRRALASYLGITPEHLSRLRRSRRAPESLDQG